MTGVAERLLGHGGWEDPFGPYADLLGADDVPLTSYGRVVTRFDHVTAALRDQRLGHRELALPVDASAHQRLTAAMFIQRNPPDHTRLRRSVSRAFTARRVAQLRPRITELAEALVDELAGAGELDLLEALAAPLPVTVIGELLGIPPADAPLFRRWSEDMAAVDGRDPAQVTSAERAAVDFAAYLGALVSERRRRPQADLLSALATLDGPDGMSDEDLVATGVLLLFAGHETTVNLIGNGVLALLRNPAEMARLRADPSLVPTAVEELLRYDGPVHLTARTALEPAQVGTVDVDPGDRVVLVLGAANRDPRRFREPQRLDVARSEGPNVAFGAGPHFCLGAPLARLEGEVALTALLSRCERLELAVDEPTWRPSLMLRGLVSLPVVA